MKVLTLVVGCALLSGCGGGAITIAVDNRDSDPYILRIIGGGTSHAWLVPANSAGQGPALSSDERPFEVIVTPDCAEVARFALGAGRQTLVVWGDDHAPTSQDGIVSGLTALTPIADPCPP
ncbi:MAG: hypothetical protein EPO00_02915 [Chloroflexota bacterium]|nr:MAG: hypothetical protein EPO00_02915 [Chloroflexota bacterium]